MGRRLENCCYQTKSQQSRKESNFGGTEQDLRGIWSCFRDSSVKGYCCINKIIISITFPISTPKTIEKERNAKGRWIFSPCGFLWRRTERGGRRRKPRHWIWSWRLAISVRSLVISSIVEEVSQSYRNWSSPQSLSWCFTWIRTILDWIIRVRIWALCWTLVIAMIVLKNKLQ